MRPDSFTETDIGRRSQPPGRYWLAVIDIDHFKMVNDNYGHMVGDEVLLLVARLMQTTFRASDLIYRYGGEEFVAIISAESDALARNVFERVRLAIEAHSFPRVEQLTISIGYAEVDPNLLPLEVLSRADRSLYRAKQDGRNLVYEFQELVERIPHRHPGRLQKCRQRLRSRSQAFRQVGTFARC